MMPIDPTTGFVFPRECKHYDMRIYLTPGDDDYPDTIYSIRCQNCNTFTKMATTVRVTIQDCRNALTAKATPPLDTSGPAPSR